MKMDLKETIQKFFGQIKNTKLLVIIFIIGVALILFPSGNKEKSEKNVDVSQDYSTYKTDLEGDLEKIIAKIKGAGKVDVMITLEDDGDTSFAIDENVSVSENGDQTSKSAEKVHVFSSESSKAEIPIITKKTYPKISGVLICASGAKNSEVKNNIIKATEALLGVKTHRIEVLERK